MLDVVMNGYHLGCMPRPDTAVTQRYVIVPCRIEHIYELADTLREKDRQEILNLGFGVKKALYRAFRNSIMCKAAIVDAKVAAVWGLGIGLRAGVSPLSDIGVPWLHTSAAVEAVPVSFIKVAKAELAAMMAFRPKLETFVAADYAQAVKLLKLLGFAVDEAEPVGLNGALYARVHIGF